MNFRATHDPITTHLSSVVTYCSHHASKTDSTYGNGKFSCVINNGNNTTHAIKVVPIKILIPNIFPNLSSEHIITLLRFSDAWNPTGTTSITIPVGNYTIQTLVDFINTKLVSMYTDDNLICKFENDRVVFTKNSYTSTLDAHLVFSMSKEFSKIIGFQNNPQTTLQNMQGVPVSNDLFLIHEQLPNSTATVYYGLTALTHPCLLSTPLVHVMARDLAPGNMQTSDSQEYNLVCSVSMHDVPYGAYAAHTASDIFVDDIDYTVPRSIGAVDFEIRDHNLQLLPIDTRFPVIVQLKLYHVDERR